MTNKKFLGCAWGCGLGFVFWSDLGLCHCEPFFEKRRGNPLKFFVVGLEVLVVLGIFGVEFFGVCLGFGSRLIFVFLVEFRGGFGFFVGLFVFDEQKQEN